MNDFNADDFLNQQTDSAMQDHYVVCPEGEYNAIIGDGENDLKFEAIPGAKDPTKTYYRLTLYWLVLDENLKAKLGKDIIRVRDQFLVDIVDGKLASGPDINVKLGNRRSAVGLNQPGQPFSLGMLRGKGPAKIRVAHEDYRGEKFASVAKAAPLA